MKTKKPIPKLEQATPYSKKTRLTREQLEQIVVIILHELEEEKKHENPEADGK
jgi:hypothetical protein